MKKILLLSALAASMAIMVSAPNRVTAQVRVSVQFGTPAYYDPQGAYAADDDYYYMPGYDAYYSPVRRVYYYNEGGRWMYCNRLPQRYGNIAYGRGAWERVRGRSPWTGRGGYSNNGGYRGGYNNGNGYRSEGRHNEERAYNYNRRENNGYNNSGNNGYHNGQNNSGYNNGNNNGNNGYNNGQNNNGYGNNGGGNGNWHGRH